MFRSSSTRAIVGISHPGLFSGLNEASVAKLPHCRKIHEAQATHRLIMAELRRLSQISL
jgi:hypothetical protein